ncbi:hypothetical protein HMPREF1548_05609 [Clostridium sp. KLE 1755]|nr:hypothetical protein HMPREF1548_05609 [Clostridium sp. KLE 1755]
MFSIISPQKNITSENPGTIRPFHIIYNTICQVFGLYFPNSFLHDITKKKNI